MTFALVSGPATLSGNTLTLTGAAGTVLVRASQAGNTTYNPATPADLSFTGLTRSANATVNFTAATAGQAGSSARIQFATIGGTSTATTGGGLTNGLIGGWATIGTSDWATYIPGLGIAPMGSAGAAPYSTAVLAPTNVATDNINISYTTATTGITANTTINSLKTSNIVVASIPFSVGATLTLASVGFLNFTSTAFNISSVVNQGFVTSGGPELFFYTQGNGTPTVNAVIKDGASAVTFIKSGGNTGTLAATNTYTGGTVVNQGTLNIAATGLIPLAADPITGVRISGGNITAFAAGAIAAGNTVIVNGSGSLTLFGDNTLAGLKFNNLGGTPTVRTFATNSATGLGSRGILTIGAGGIVSTSENVTTTALAESTPTRCSSSSSAASPYIAGSPAARAARTRAGSRSIARNSMPCDSSTRARFCPTRPKPQSSTCSRAAMPCSSGSFASPATGDTRSLRRRSRSTSRAIFRLWRSSSGALTRLSTIATNNSCVMV